VLLAYLGFALFMQGRVAEAQDLFRRGLELSQAVSGKQTATYALGGLAALADVARRRRRRGALPGLTAIAPPADLRRWIALLERKGELVRGGVHRSYAPR
jgi:hypothetical protein